MPDRRRSGSGHRHVDVDPLLLEVERAELEAEVIARAADVAGGLAPVWARRSLYPHELAARVSFAALADDIDRAAAALARRLLDDRASMVALIDTYLADAPNPAVALARLNLVLERGLLTIPGAGLVVDQAERAILADLERLADAGAARVLGEADLQGVALPEFVGLDEAAQAQLEARARRLAVNPHVELVQALQVEAARLGNVPPAELQAGLTTAAQDLSVGPLELAGRNAAAGADGLGRQAVVDAAGAGRQPARIYASELLDGNTCPACSPRPFGIDGTEYSTIAEARRDYPAGIYKNCQGRERCRGTLVFVWPEEVAPTLPTPFGL